MAVIVILVGYEKGHVLPTFCMAKKLLARGHRVCYFGLAEIEAQVRKQGFEFRRIMDDLLPPDFMTRLRGLSAGEAIQQRKLIEGRYLGSLMRGEALDGLMRELKPDVVLTSRHHYFVTVVTRYRYNVPIVLLNTSIMGVPRARACQSVVDYLIGVPGATSLVDLLKSAGVEFKNFADIAALILQIPELVLYPSAFELPDVGPNPLTFYVGHEVDLDRIEDPFDWSQLYPDRPLIYCSLGSQQDIKGEVSRRFIRTVIDAAVRRPNWQFVVSLGARLNAKEFGPAPPHVILGDWAPQLQMLSRANVMITHAGIGTVKECILNGVPMLALPLMRDQFDCADRIVHHGLGVRGDVERIGPEELISALDQLIANESFRERVRVMRDEFERAEALNLSITIIEEVISGCLPSNSI